MARGGISLADPALDRGTAYWVEGRPAEGGRQVVVGRPPYGEPGDLTSAGMNARTKVHEYGGGACWVHAGTVFFTNFADQRLYRQDPGRAARPITPDSDGRLRYADGVVTPDGRLIVCVRERHERDEVVNELVALPADGSEEARTIALGRDFYAFPRVSPDGRLLAWTCWDHPQMPWDGTELWVTDLAGGRRPGEPRPVAGGPTESIFQPGWSPDGVLHFVSDRTGWWNLYREPALGHIEALWPMEAEFGTAQWEFGYSTYAFLVDGRIACIYERDGDQRLALLDPGSSELVDLDLPFTAYDPPYVRAEGSHLLFVAGSSTLAPSVVLLDFTTREVAVLRESMDVSVDPDYVSAPRAIEFPTEGGTAHALFFAPANPGFVGPVEERPPLVVMSHGGPTAAARDELDLRTQFFTSRGIAVVDVNYGGSTGYGRAYRERLRGAWGVVDVVDCVNAARFLAQGDDVDGARMVIRGGSAGGYTTLCALTFHDVFAAGASYFGIGDLEALARDTHKFESRYLDGLLGPYPEAADVYRARSPVRFTHLLSRPVLLLQGLEDEVVPPSQAEDMARALQARGIPHAYLGFEGEQHGFRKAENMRRALEAELSFYAQILGFEVADDIEPVPIERH